MSTSLLVAGEIDGVGMGNPTCPEKVGMKDLQRERLPPPVESPVAIGAKGSWMMWKWLEIRNQLLHDGVTVKTVVAEFTP